MSRAVSSVLDNQSQISSDIAFSERCTHPCFPFIPFRTSTDPPRSRRSPSPSCPPRLSGTFFGVFVHLVSSVRARMCAQTHLGMKDLLGDSRSVFEIIPAYRTSLIFERVRIQPFVICSSSPILLRFTFPFTQQKKRYPTEIPQIHRHGRVVPHGNLPNRRRRRGNRRRCYHHIRLHSRRFDAWFCAVES